MKPFVLNLDACVRVLPLQPCQRSSEQKGSYGDIGGDHQFAGQRVFQLLELDFEIVPDPQDLKAAFIKQLPAFRQGQNTALIAADQFGIHLFFQPEKKLT